MSELKKKQAPSLYNDHYTAASIKILQRNKNDFIDRKTVWRIAILSFLLGAVLVVLTFWFTSKTQSLPESKETPVGTSHIIANPSAVIDTKMPSTELSPHEAVPSEVVANAATDSAMNSSAATNPITIATAPKTDVIEDWINTHLTDKNAKPKAGSANNDNLDTPKNTETNQATQVNVALVAPALVTAAAVQNVTSASKNTSSNAPLANNALTADQAKSNPFKVLETDDIANESVSKTKKTNKNKPATQKKNNVPQKNKVQPATKSVSKANTKVNTGTAQQQARQQSKKKDK